MNFKGVIKVTLLADFGSCLVMFLSYLIVRPDRAYFALFYSFGNILIPAFIAVLLFRLLYKKLTLSNPFRTILFQVFSLTIIFLVVIFIWAAADVLLFGQLHHDHWNITKEFNLEFKPWLPISRIINCFFFIGAIFKIVDKMFSQTKVRIKH